MATVKQVVAERVDEMNVTFYDPVTQRPTASNPPFQLGDPVAIDEQTDVAAPSASEPPIMWRMAWLRDGAGRLDRGPLPARSRGVAFSHATCRL